MRRSSLGFAEGMIVGPMRGRDSKSFKAFDWESAAKLIKERGAKEVSIGLMEDWDCTSVTILECGQVIKPEYSEHHLLSNWATPMMVIDEEEVECYYDNLGLEEARKSQELWPKVALEILQADKLKEQ